MTYLSLEKIYKVFKLEAERGFDNRAVVGGLDKFLVSWEPQARTDNLSEDVIQAVKKQINEYPQLDPGMRENALKKLWQQLHTIRGENQSTPVFPSGNQAGSASPEQSRKAPVGINKNAFHHGQLQRRNDFHPEREVNRQASKEINAQPDISSQPGSQAGHRETENDKVRSERKILQDQVRPSKPEVTISGLNAPLKVINGIGPRHAQTLSSLNLDTLNDILFFFPRRYDDYSQLKTINHLNYGEEITVIASVESVSSHPIRGGSAQLTEAVVSDGTGTLRLTWFNQPWQINRLRKGQPVTIAGKVEQFLGRPVMNNPECEPIEQDQLNTNRIVPVYPLTAHITQHWLRRIMFQTVNYWAPRLPDYLPASIRKDANLLDLSAAVAQCHFPESQEVLKAARERLAFDEIFFIQLGVLRQKNTWRQETSEAFAVEDEWLQTQISRLPFQLTQAQTHALEDIRSDLLSGKPMNRLLQGDVGSGKTVIAAISISMVAQHGAQSAVMAPTSILADQHYKSMLGLLSNSDDSDADQVKPEEIRLLIGDTPEAEKQEIRAGLESGKIKLIIGTHALLEDPVIFQHLQMIVVDEQHRFGVEQRARLRAKGNNPHLLVMTATPIPRSLALTVYGDLDLTVMDELPPGRQVVETHVIDPRSRERAYVLIRSQIEKKHQAFIIYPLVEQGENEEICAAVEEHARIQKEIFPDLRIGLLHGRMKPEEKDEVMAHFRDGDFQILVSTSVVEVGVDISNATVMLVEGANRFGLAQLHQFRGRVGRGDAKSYCLLIPDEGNGIENERLSVMTETNDGFILAERDLEQRGPGEFLGKRQSGFAELRVASLTDVRLIEKARIHAQALFEKDPELKAVENQSLLQNFQLFWTKHQGDIS